MAEENKTTETKTNYDNLFELISGLSEQVTNLNTRIDTMQTQKVEEPKIEKTADEAFLDWLNK